MVLVDGVAGGRVSPFDRGLNYGDGLFETIRLHEGRLPLLERHLTRLQAGCVRLGIPWPGDDALADDLRQVTGDGEGVVRIVVTRGNGGRGYAPPERVQATRIVSHHPLPHATPGGLSVGVCNVRLGRNRHLAGLKHVSRLEQVIAAAEAQERGWQEGLMLDDRDCVVEGTRHNLFYVRDGRLLTPPVDECGVAGVMRAQILELFATGDGCEEPLGYDALHALDEVLLCNAVVGVRVVNRLEGRKLAGGHTGAEVAHRLREAGVAWAVV